jgi:hypothetical protein
MCRPDRWSGMQCMPRFAAFLGRARSPSAPFTMNRGGLGETALPMRRAPINAHHVTVRHTGRLNQNVLPRLGTLCTPMRPLWASTASRQK